MALLEQLHRTELLSAYPSARALEADIAQRFGVAPERVVVTAGADDALDRACRALLGAGRELVLPVPTFEMLPRYARLTGATVCEVPWSAGPYPLTEVLSSVGANTSAIAIVSPNNPTGSVASSADLKRLAQAAPNAALLVDLAYAEFADDDLMSTALALDNAIVFRTLSKAWGLAGLRVGYVITNSAVATALRTVGQPYAVAGPSLAIARRWLEIGDPTTRAFITRVRSERNQLEKLLGSLDVGTQPSQANFVLARVANPAWLEDGLAGLGIAVRRWPEREALADAVRISCPGNARRFERLTAALSTTLAPQALLFDLDGVLADVRDSYRRAIKETAGQFGVRIDDDAIAQAKAAGDANNDWALTQRLMEAAGTKVSLADTTAAFEQIYQDGKLWQRETLLCDRNWLAALRKRIPLGIVTGRPRRDAARFLEQHDISALFDTVVCMEDAAAKPNPAPVQRALDELRINRAWMIGDTPDDVRAARAAGVVPLGFVQREIRAQDPEATVSLAAAGAARILDRLEALEEVLP